MDSRNRLRVSVFLGIILVSFASPNFFLTFPSEIQFADEARICLIFSEQTRDYYMNISLVLGDSVTPLVSFQSQDTDSQRCYPVPRYDEDIEGKFEYEGVVDRQNVSGGKSVSFHKSRKFTFLQTDKPVYKPGQTVKFRIVTLDENFIPLDVNYSVVAVEDRQKSRLAQWRDVRGRQGVAELSFPLGIEPSNNKLTIKVERESAWVANTEVIVEEYVLPKYEVNLNVPKALSPTDTEIHLQVCGKYTYGKGVEGSVKGCVCRRLKRHRWFIAHPERYDEQTCVEFSGPTDNDGCFSFKVNMTDFPKTTQNDQTEFHVETELKELGTEITFNKTATIDMKGLISSMDLIDMDPTYKPGIPFTIKVKLLNVVGAPYPGETIQLRNDLGAFVDIISMETDKDGIAQTHLNTQGSNSTMKLTFIHQPKVKVEHETAKLSYSISPQISPSHSYLHISPASFPLSCDSVSHLSIHYIIGEQVKEETESVTVYHQIIIRRQILKTASHTIQLSKGMRGNLTLEFPPSFPLSPSVHLLSFSLLPGGQIIAHSRTFAKSKCFNNKASVRFAESSELPGAAISMRLKAFPGSLCALRAVDKSVLLQRGREEMSPGSIYQSVLSHYPTHQKDDPLEYLPCVEPPPSHPFPVLEPRRPVHHHRPPPPPPPRERPHYPQRPDPSPSTQNLYEVLKSLGLKAVSNIALTQPSKCHPHYIYRFGQPMRNVMFGPGLRVGDEQKEGLPGMAFAMNVDSAIVLGSMPIEEEIKTTIRTYFPETWIWDLVPIGESGVESVPVTVPDAITQWETDGFCTSPQGFGLIPSASLRAFQPFFVSLSLPYSVVRGEGFRLKASVFNYLTSCISVHVELLDTHVFNVSACETCLYKACVYGGRSHTFYWDVEATELGESNVTVRAEATSSQSSCQNQLVSVPHRGAIDTVTKSLLVEAEGVTQEVSHSALLCTKGDEAKELISLPLPHPIVVGSAKAQLTVVGDVMGSAMSNLAGLLRLPMGCGEQNMILFAPNIYILNYLQLTQQLSQDTRSKATGYMLTGYQRELTYKHTDGSYSAFGNSDPEGSTWLTAFVLKSFSAAQPHMFIDEKHLSESLSWLQSQHRPDGVFESRGKIIHKDMQGGVGDLYSLTAYITAALLEMNTTETRSMASRSLRYLLSRAAGGVEIYSLCLVSYSLTLAGEERARELAMEELGKRAIIEDGMMHWERARQTETETKTLVRSTAPSIEVEMTSYVLLATLSHPQVSAQDLAQASRIVKWLSRQRNPQGGFSSTQDTVVALQALSLFASITFSQERVNEVRVTEEGERVSEGAGAVAQFHISSDNSLLVQQQALPVPANYSLTVTGNGCVFIQASLTYNVPQEKRKPTFSIETNIFPQICTKKSKETFRLNTDIKYIGKDRSNMALIDIKLISGHIPVKASLIKLKTQGLVKRYEIKENHVFLYLEQLSHEVVSLSVMLEKVTEISHLKPGIIKVYDYYETDEFAIATYTAPCSDDAGSDKDNN